LGFYRQNRKNRRQLRDGQRRDGQPSKIAKIANVVMANRQKIIDGQPTEGRREQRVRVGETHNTNGRTS